jgi:hypothetical protein
MRLIYPGLFLLIILVYGCKKDTNPSSVIDSLAGYYSYAGNVQSGNHDTVYPAVPINGASTITVSNATSLVYNGIPLNYNSINYQTGDTDSLNAYIYNEVDCCGYTQILFRRPYNDSIFITVFYTDNPASWTITNMRGKLHS